MATKQKPSAPRSTRRPIPKLMDVTATLRVLMAEDLEKVDGKKVQFRINDGEGELLLEFLADLGDRGVSLSELMVEKIEDDEDLDIPLLVAK